MNKVNITLAFDDEKLDALEYSLQKDKSSVQAKLDEALQKIYQESVPEAIREYLDSKSSVAKPKRSARPSSKAKARLEAQASALNAEQEVL